MTGGQGDKNAKASGYPILQLPGTWMRARQLLATWGPAEDLSGTRMQLDAGATLADRQIFADEMVGAVLIERCAEQLVVAPAGPNLHAQFLRLRSALRRYRPAARARRPADQRM